MRPLAYLNTKKGNARTMMEAFAAGSGAEVTTKLEFVPGREAVFWGVDRLTLSLWNEVVRTGTPFVYVDNGYFASKWQGGDHYRITRNAEQCFGTGTTDGSRWRNLGLGIAPWRKSDGHVLIACQSDFWHERHGHGDASAYAAYVMREVRKHTERDVIVRRKPAGGHNEPSLAEQLRDCWAVVTHSSMVGVQALLAGVPVFCAPGAMAPMASGELREIERPRYPEDREVWAGILADNQWRLPEISSGVAWKALQ